MLTVMGFPYACFSAHTSSSSSSHRVQSTHSLFRDLICRLLCVLRFCHSVLLAHIYIYICINLCMYVNNGIFVIWLKIVVCIAYCCVSANLPLKWLEKWSSKTHDNAMNEHCSNRMYCCWREAMSQSFTIKCIMIVVQVLCALSQQPRYYNGVKR